MTPERRPGGRVLHGRRSALMLVLALGAAACTTADPVPGASLGVGTSPIAPASLTSSPSPTLTYAPDVASVAATRLREFRSARIEINGQTTSGAPLRISGNAALVADASRFDMSVESGEGRYATVEIAVAEGRFWSRNGGPFFRVEPASGTDSIGLAEFLHSLVELSPDGTRSRDGRLLHRLAPPPGTVVPPSALGLEGPGLTDFRADLEVYAESDGTPVELTFNVAWRQAAATADPRVVLLLNYRLAGLDEPLTVEPPTEVWATFDSERLRYRVGYPERWDLEEMDDGDSFLGPDGSELFVYTSPDAGTLNEWVTESILYWQEELEQRPESNEPVTIGGEDGRWLSYRGDLDDVPTFVMDAVVVHEGRGYGLEWYSVPGNESADRRTFQDILSTFDFR
jgi:hypothetical protein